MKRYCILLFLLSATVALGSPVRAMLATRALINASAKAEYTAKDYIQDGLIAMWDGEWNAGWGVHDNNATTWVDLTGNGHDWTNIVAGGWVNGNSRKLSCRATGLSSAFLSDEVKTVSFACENLGTSGSQRQIAAFVVSPPKHHLWFYRDRFICSNNSSYSPKINIKSVDSFTIQYMVVTLNSRPQNLGWFKDVPCVEYLSEWINGSNSAGIGDSANHYDTAYLHGNIFNVRIYNRYLTQEEITYNWNIDKERFGL